MKTRAVKTQPAKTEPRVAAVIPPLMMARPQQMLELLIQQLVQPLTQPAQAPVKTIYRTSSPR